MQIRYYKFLKNFSSCLAIILTIILFFNCTSTKNKPSSSTAQKIEQSDFLELVKAFQFDYLIEKDLSPSENKILRILQEFIEDPFQNISFDSKPFEENFKLEELFYRIWVNSKIFQSKWNELAKLSSNILFDPDSTLVLANDFAKIPAEVQQYEKEIDTIEFKVSPFGTPIITIKINGAKRDFLFDTGTNYTIISAETAKSCDINPISYNKTTVITASNYKISAFTACLDELKIGTFTFSNLPALIVDDYFLRLKSIVNNEVIKFDGIVGWNILKYAKFTIDYRQRKLIIQKPKNEATRQKNLFWFGIPIIVAYFQNIPLLFGFDTGSERSTLTKNIFEKINFSEFYKQTKFQGSIGGWKYNPSVVVPFLEITCKSHRISFFDINTVEIPKDYFFSLDGFFGADLLRNAIITIDLKNGIFEISQ